VHFRPFLYGTNFGAKHGELVQLKHKFVQQSHFGIFRNERTRSTLFEPKLMFWGVLDRFVTERTSVQNEPKWCDQCISSCNKVAMELFATNTPNPPHRTPKLMFWGVSDRFVTARTSLQKGAEVVRLMHNFVQ
jgi:hypothetical protein